MTKGRDTLIPTGRAVSIRYILDGHFVMGQILDGDTRGLYVRPVSSEVLMYIPWTAILDIQWKEK